MAQPTTWFDMQYDDKMESANAKEALAMIASDERIIKAVQEAIDDRNATKVQPGWAGPTAAQAVRESLARVLLED